jgi:hypothetical protein
MSGSDTGGTVTRGEGEYGMPIMDLITYSFIMFIIALPMAMAMMIVSACCLWVVAMLVRFIFSSKLNSKVPSIVFVCIGLVVSIASLVGGVLIMRKFYRMTETEQRERWVLNPTATALAFNAIGIAFFTFVMGLKNGDSLCPKPNSVVTDKNSSQSKRPTTAITNENGHHKRPLPPNSNKIQSTKPHHSMVGGPMRRNRYSRT